MPTQDLVDRLHRRPPGPRVLLYLDTWALSDMVAGTPGYDALRERLESEVKAGRVLCPESPEHRSEWVLIDDEALRDGMSELADRLSAGIKFLPLQDIEYREMDAAAAAFCGQEEPRGRWEEAFVTDPHIALDELHTDFLGAPVRVRVRMPTMDGEREEVRKRTAIAPDIQNAYQQDRDQQFTFEQLDAGGLDKMLKWKLGPLFDPEGTEARVGRRQEEFDNDPSPATLSRLTAANRSGHVVAALVDRYPELIPRKGQFYWSECLQAMPTLRYPALLRAGLAAEPNARKARPGDEIDVEHILFGLSRCDIATADTAMCHMLRERQLVPSSCVLVSAGEGAEGILAALDARLEQVDSA